MIRPVVFPRGASPPGYGALADVAQEQSRPGGRPAKSMMTSARSPGMITRCCSWPGGRWVDLDRGVQVAAVGADLPHGRAVDRGVAVDQEHLVAAGIGAVQEQETVALGLDFEERPDLAVDHDGVADELRHPEGCSGLGMKGTPAGKKSCPLVSNMRSWITSGIGAGRLDGGGLAGSVIR